MSVKKRDNLSISSWIRRFSHLVPAGGSVLDLAAGSGRHSAWFLDFDHPVTAVDRRVDELELLQTAGTKATNQRLEIVEADLEDGSPWPLSDRLFDAVIVVNYLHRPLFPRLLAALAPGGVLLYETFAASDTAAVGPKNPDFLLRTGELLDVVRDRLHVVAFEHGRIDAPNGPAVKQRIAALAGEGPAPLSAA